LLDSHSVARLFDDNSSHMLRAINDAVKRGAHLGLRAGST
jgi:phage regulator Rha-like protein